MSVGGEIVKKMIAEVEGRRYEPPKPHAPKVERHRTQGSIGGEMVRKMIEAYEKSMKQPSFHLPSGRFFFFEPPALERPGGISVNR